MTSIEAVRNKWLREKSGNVEFPAHDMVTSFLYELMRDHIPPGTIETIIRNVEDESSHGEIAYSNGWLAHYANYLSQRLRKNA